MGRDKIPALVWSLLQCPQCGGELEIASASLICFVCGTEFADRSGDGGLDLRLRQPKGFSLSGLLGTELVPSKFSFGPIGRHSEPSVDFQMDRIPWHLSADLLSHFPKSNSESAIALDLGCGTGIHKSVCEFAGYRWVGLDYANPAAPILGDGHALPFRTESMDFVLSMAVLEHIQHPQVLGQEVLRVLKPGGVFIGTVAFMEPFHGSSYYHHSHLGTYNTLASSGFDVLRIGPNPNWSFLRAQLEMGGLFPKLPRFAGAVFARTIEFINKWWWAVGHRVSGGAIDTSRTMRLLKTTGAIDFVARKPLFSK